MVDAASRAHPFSHPNVEDLDEHGKADGKIDVALEICCPNPSAIRVTPMRRRKLKASILTVGWRSTKPLIGPAIPS